MYEHPASISDKELLAECDEARTRRSGPGGQHRNKVESAVVLTHRKTHVSAEANERRSQHENRRKAVFRLRVNLALQHRTDADPKPSALWNSRCHAGQIRINPEHSDFPALLAEAIDVISARDFDVKSAAELLGCSTSQLVRFLKLEPRALALVNENRKTTGQRPLK